MIPPPNITGQLHMGHALDETMQDILIRYKRMSGFETLWLPGTDHASIATEVKVVNKLAAEGISKTDIGREGFLEHAWAWKKEYGGRIVTQLRKLGSSCDWERERFTMDDGCSRAVTKVFVDLYKKGLIYRGDRIVNWCPHCKTAISNAEVDFVEQPSNLWHVRYDAPDGSYSIICATTRPETILGDTGIAVNPNDPRYTEIVGKTVVVPIIGREIPIVADEYVEMDFGTGALKSLRVMIRTILKSVSARGSPACVCSRRTGISTNSAENMPDLQPKNAAKYLLKISGNAAHWLKSSPTATTSAHATAAAQLSNPWSPSNGSLP